MRQRCTGPLVYTIKSGVLFCFVLFCFVLFCFVCLFVCDARHAFRGRGSDRGVWGVHGKPSTGRCAQCRFRGVPGPGRGDTKFQNIYQCWSAIRVLGGYEEGYQ